MTIQEAIETGKPFKREDWDDRYYIRFVDGVYVQRNGDVADDLTVEDAIATDYEVSR